MSTSKIKENLLFQCSKLIEARHHKILQVIKDIENSLKEESKSTSGDKHHTGRAMLHIDRENAGNQLREIDMVCELLNKVPSNLISENVKLGSLSYTSNGIYFISISAGILQHKSTTYYCVAPNSPIGLLLLGKRKNETFQFNSNTIEILKVF